MAISTKITCIVCKQEKQVMHNSGEPAPRICDSCRQAEREKKKQEYLAGLEKLEMLERIRRLEELVYDHGRVPHGYQPPPRF